MKIVKFDKAECKRLRSAVECKLQEVANAYGVNIKTGSGTFSGSNFSFKVEASVIDANGTILSKDAEHFKQYAGGYELEPTDLGKEFKFKNEVFQIKGLSLRSSKFPILALKVSDNKTYKFPSDLILRSLGKTSTRTVRAVEV